MKNILVFIVLGLLLFSCTKDKKTKNPNFVSVNNNKFELKNKDYFPLMLNYVVELRKIEDSIVLSAPKYYEDLSKYEANTFEENNTQLRAHLQLIKEMGFNSIRLIFISRMHKDSVGYFYNNKEKLYIHKNSKKILSALAEYLDIVESFDLKVMLLIRKPIESETVEDFTIELLNKFKNRPVIFSYDFFNEPLYFDNVQKKNRYRDKFEAYNIVSDWRDMMREYAPDQLFTIGFSEPIEVFEWDPSILPVDFLAFHTYHPLRVPNEIYWYSKYTSKPWMIGETALPADNDSIPYLHQQFFMREVYQRVIDCGGAGLGWWEFQELPNSHYEAAYTGLLNHKGVTKTKQGGYSIIGTVKPAVEEISKFKDYKKGTCNCKSNYYNMLGYNNILVKGRVIDKDTKKPIPGAVIRGWSKWWSIGLNSFSDENGWFYIYSNDECIHYNISAPGYNLVKYMDKELVYKPAYEHNYKMGDLPLQRLKYNQIIYTDFLVNDTLNIDNTDIRYIFKYDSSKFNKAKFIGDLGVVELEKLDLDSFF